MSGLERDLFTFRFRVLPAVAGTPINGIPFYDADGNRLGQLVAEQTIEEVRTIDWPFHAEDCR